MAQARAAIARDAEWEGALEKVLSETGGGEPTDLAFLFASHRYGEKLPELVRRARQETGASILVGCSGQGIIGGPTEVEGEPALSLLRLALPGADLDARWLTQRDVEGCSEANDWRALTGVGPDRANAWIVFADPFRIDVERLVAGLSSAYPSLPLIGGLASGDFNAPKTFVFLNDEAYAEGAVALSLGGGYTVRTIVSQGAEPISDPWTITDADGHVVKTIGQRPAMEILIEALRGLPPELQARAQRNLLVGLAMDEYRDEFRRGDFLIRNLAGVDQRSGSIAIGANPRVGQTIQFQLRDARAADEELQELLTRTRESLGEVEPLAAVLCTCNGRGVNLFGRPDHDAGAISEQLGLTSIAGFFCNGEIGPVGAKNFLHGYTASVALIVPQE